VFTAWCLGDSCHRTPEGFVMITFYRSASIASGKVPSALGFAKEISAYVKDKVGVDVGIAVPVGGNPNRIGWAARYDNLAAMEAATDKLMADPKYLELVSKGADNFIAGSVHDEIWRTI
jgi:hypothetical protein